MKKAIVLTYIKLSDSEQTMLRNASIFKIALNQHAEELKPDIRITADYILDKLYKNFQQKIISVRDRLKDCSDRTILANNIEFKGSTILASIDWLINENYTDILIIGDNTVNTDEFKETVKKEIDKIKCKANIYQFKNGNFNLPIKSIQEFINEKY